MLEETLQFNLKNVPDLSPAARQERQDLVAFMLNRFRPEGEALLLVKMGRIGEEWRRLSRLGRKLVADVRRARSELLCEALDEEQLAPSADDLAGVATLVDSRLAQVLVKLDAEVKDLVGTSPLGPQLPW